MQMEARVIALACLPDPPLDFRTGFRSEICVWIGLATREPRDPLLVDQGGAADIILKRRLCNRYVSRLLHRGR